MPMATERRRAGGDEDELPVGDLPTPTPKREEPGTPPPEEASAGLAAARSVGPAGAGLIAVRDLAEPSP